MPGKVVAMLSVAAVSRDDAWAIGLAAARGAQTGRSVIEHWSGRGWRHVQVPGTKLAAFDSTRTPAGSAGPPFAVIGASSASNVWAFNQMTGAWLRWNGHRWSEGLVSDHSGRAATLVTSALVLGSGQVWVFGAQEDAHGGTIPFAARFSGRRWTVTPMPRKVNLPVSAASAVSPDDIWAVIGYGGQVPLPAQGNGGALAHWNGHGWRQVPLPAQFASGGDPTSIAALSDREVWVGGGAENSKLGLGGSGRSGPV